MENLTIQNLIKDAENTLMLAVAREVSDGYEIEDTLDRKYSEGFLDGIRHVAIALYVPVNGRDADFITRLIQSLPEQRKMTCQHDRYSETARDGETETETVYTCDNCNAIVRTERFI